MMFRMIDEAADGGHALCFRLFKGLTMGYSKMMAGLAIRFCIVVSIDSRNKLGTKRHKKFFHRIFGRKGYDYLESYYKNDQ